MISAKLIKTSRCNTCQVISKSVFFVTAIYDISTKHWIKTLSPFLTGLIFLLGSSFIRFSNACSEMVIKAIISSIPSLSNAVFNADSSAQPNALSRTWLNGSWVKTICTPAEKNLFTEKQNNVYAILESNVNTDQGKPIILKYKTSFDAQSAYNDCHNYHLKSTTAMMD
jgi:hypothetical protein